MCKHATRATCLTLAGALWLLATGCHGDVQGPDSDPGDAPVGPTDVPADPPAGTLEVLATLIVSNPTGSLAGNAVASLSSSSASGVIYASLPPGSVPDGESAVIETRATGAETMTRLLDGGFDPVPVAAVAGDTLDIVLQLAGDGGVLQYISVVPERRPPVVVRTDPPPGRRDVPLNAVLLVVFSEPIDGGTLTTVSVQLLRDGAPVDGTLEFADGANISATFTPASALAAGSDHTFLVTQTIRDLDGDALESPATVVFTTVAVAPVGSLAVSVTTTGIDLQTGDYRLVLDGDAGTPIGVNGSVTLEGLAEGPHVISLLDVAEGCVVAGTNPRTAAVGAGETAIIDFTVTCGPISQQIALERDGQIYLVNPDGTGLVRISDGPGDRDPAWSPDGHRIAFVSDRTGQSDVYLMDADGSNLTSRTARGQVYALSWSPDGARIALSIHEAGHTQIETISVIDDGAGPTVFVDRQGRNETPAWSPDGATILFVSDWTAFDFAYDIYAATPGGSDITQLTLGFASAELTRYQHPAWSPDGTTIAFVYAGWSLGWDVSDPGRFRVALMSADGAFLRDLAWAGDITWFDNEGPGPGSLAWSPDGSGIVYEFVDCNLYAESHCVDERRSVRYVSIDGTQNYTLVEDARSPSWRP